MVVLNVDFFIIELIKILITLCVPLVLGGGYWFMTLRSKSNQIRCLIKKRKFVLYFAGEKSDMHKVITFDTNGEIKEGNNHNESYWCVSFGKLKLMNSEKKVFSEFKWDQVKGLLVHTNNPCLPSVMGQYIVPFVTNHSNETK